ncbi:MAG: AmmeMemoRadiSam system radical SAM enzyme [Candidatus Solincola sediminis]|uniref:AmmeMemoRadiSam system radical SAM enzyme n=1 Tax=Candidatus Solincola sediminis TaxID=1797199 RepID=A0A1F2WRL3_9ACTN|nr:MAG: AmmeMemoRadiSam system radical SAM enzyme [Candidatus Solincola sediminis]OFW59938.1 MAG: AmmeMemoRadiSam system radical SAM enzyme [Candidatus Solincola sediminis]
MKEALYWEKLDNKVHCLLCPQDCRIAEGKQGFCGVRLNESGVLYSEIYERIMAAQMDPIEKKPLYHFHPGSIIYSIGTRGCNQRCDFCQNWHMLEPDARTGKITARQVVDNAKEEESIGIAYTYNEPTIWYEFVLECSQLAREENLANVLVSNGSVCEEPFRRLAPFIDAMNIDVKSMDPEFYRKICKSKLEPVLETCRIAKEAGIELEITNLVIPTLNDSDELIYKLVDFVSELGSDVPLHFSAYFPSHTMTIEPTPLSSLERAKEIASEKLYYVYLGNVAAGDASNTHCPRCRNLLISRSRYLVSLDGIKNGACDNCGRKADIVL